MMNITHIFGCPRSGTSWLWSLLEEHPKIIPYVKGEAKNGIYKTSESGYYVNNNIKDFTEFTQRNKDRRVLEKTPIHTLHHKQIVDIFKESKNILIIRHPYSIYESIMNCDVFKLTKMQCVKLINTYYNTYYQIQTNKNIHIIKYENLVYKYSRRN